MIPGIIITAAIAVAACVGVFFYAAPAVITVIADSDLNLYDKASSDPSARKAISTLKAGDTATVNACIDIKHYIVLEIEIADGRKAYVIDGRFHVRRENPWRHSGPGRIIWGC